MESTVRKPLRLWPGVVLAIVLVLARYVIPPIAGDAEVFEMPVGLIAVMGGMLCAVAIVLWWLLFSRAPWAERLGAIILMIVAVFAMRAIVHESIRGGMMGMMLPIYSIPILTLALVFWAVVTRHFADGVRRTSLIAAILLACVPWVVLRTAGLAGDGAEFHWRWTETPEQRLLAQAADEPLDPSTSSGSSRAQSRDDSARGRPAPPPPPAVKTGQPAAVPEAPPTAKTEPATPAATATPVESPAKSERGVARIEWPGFRGPRRDGVVRGVRINTDWAMSPPVELWRRPIGPGWSSFAVAGDLVYTQEQRGDDEIVACYNARTGKPVWRHRDKVRFWESNAGPGPRATPTVSGGRVYAMGATGIVNALNAANGAVVWSRDAAADTGVKVPGWGFAGSPLVVDDVVIVAASGRLVAYDIATGHPRWFGPTEGAGYSSPHLVTIEGVPQILLLRGRTTSVAPANGTVLWEYTGEPSVSIVQPAQAADRDLLIATGDGMGAGGLLRLAVAHGPGGWTTQERWTSRGLKPYFNDFVVHKGHAFGFDGSILSCISLEDGSRKWKGGRYGSGQLVLLPDQDVLLVVSEEGELALVSATPDQFTEIARFKAIEGKTWNHPVIVGNVLLVRNGEEMAAFRLSLAGTTTGSSMNAR
jgi:outer membrane protein assembly factor BamB